ncbi:hypothetical protein [Leifsonia sp. LS-T14]|uniref:hypothetical protein n=1 Tax=unclassified Leifsonia TaxID=2663824 RepID=UPI0035A61698
MSTVRTAPAPYGWVRHLMPRIVIGALIAAALVGVYAVVLGRFDETCWRLIGTIGLFVFFALVSWYDADVSARRAAWFGAVSVITSVYLFGIGLWKVWMAVQPVGGGFGYDATEPWWEPFSWFLLVIVTRIGLLHIHLVLNTQRRFTGPIMSKVTMATLVLVGLLTAGLSLPLIWTRADFGETYWRLVAVAAILDALGTVLIPLTYSLFGPKAVRPAPTAPAAFVPGPPTFAPAAVPSATAPAAAATPVGAPVSAYPRLDAATGLRLEWPRYINGQPVPARPDGSPDFTGVVGY